MMSEQPQFGKKSLGTFPEEMEEAPIPHKGPVLRNNFADEYEGFEQEVASHGDYVAEEFISEKEEISNFPEPPAPVEGLWDNHQPQQAAAPAAFAAGESQDIWGAASAPQPYIPSTYNQHVYTEESQGQFRHAVKIDQETDYSAPPHETNHIASEENWYSQQQESVPPQYAQGEHAKAEDHSNLVPVWQSEEPEKAVEFNGQSQEPLGSQLEQSSIVTNDISSIQVGPKFGFHSEEALANQAPQLQAENSNNIAFPVELEEQPYNGVNTSRIQEKEPDIQDELQSIIAQHHLWLQSSGKDGRRATFRGDRFRGVDFSGLFLPDASFRNAGLTGANFKGATLERADFAEAILTSADFSRTVLNGANFQRAQLSHADFSGCEAPEADFSYAEAIGASFHSSRLEWGNFRDAQLSEADLRNANCAKSNLRGASLFRAKLENANLTQADCREANLDQATIENAILLQTNFRLANLQGVAMQTADFSQAVDVPVEAQASSTQKEREWLQQEAQRIEILKAELLAKERELDNEREKLRHSPAASRMVGRVLNGLAESSEMQGMLKSYSKLFIKIGASWLVMVLAVIGLVLNALAEIETTQLNFLELLILGLMLLTPLVLCLVGVVKSMNLSSRLLEYMPEQDS